MTSQLPINAITTKTSTNSSTLKSSLSQGKKVLGKGKNTKPVDKGKKCVVISTPSPVASTSTGSSSNLRNKLWDKAKVTATLIQELTEELQLIDQESLNDEHDSEVTQESDLQQDDSEDYLTETEEQWLNTRQNLSSQHSEQKKHDNMIDKVATTIPQEDYNIVNHTE